MDEKFIKQVYISGGSAPIQNSPKKSLEEKNIKIQSVDGRRENVHVISRPEDSKISKKKESQFQSKSDETQIPNKIFLTDDKFSTPKTDKDSEKKKGIWEKIKKIKNIEIYIAIAFVVIVLLIYFSSSVSSCSFNNRTTTSDDGYTSAYDYCLETEKRLAKLLSSIENAGKVDIMITFESTPERVIAYITSSSKSISTGGDGGYNENDQNSSSPQIIYVSGNQIPLILKELSPKVIGVLIVAEGADDVKVKLDIINAVSVLLNISKDQIKVLTMNKG
ncbi:MAG TPA: hypothetical protein VIL26_07440 [Clostridia bacterium]